MRKEVCMLHKWKSYVCRHCGQWFVCLWDERLFRGERRTWKMSWIKQLFIMHGCIVGLDEKIVWVYHDNLEEKYEKGTNKLVSLFHFWNSQNSWHGKSVGNVRAARVRAVIRSGDATLVWVSLSRKLSTRLFLWGYGLLGSFVCFWGPSWTSELCRFVSERANLFYCFLVLLWELGDLTSKFFLSI